jgi:diacylglycerol kinase family enzyme
VEALETAPGPDFARSLSRRLEREEAEVVIAAGGDGTLRDVVEALLGRPAARRPSLAIVPMGTANNAARSIDAAASPPWDGRRVDRLARTLAGGCVRDVDAGRANGRAFLGSIAVGMDADILAWRNRARPRVPSAIAGYPLYLASCAVNALREHGGPVRIQRQSSAAGDPAIVETRAVNVLVTNTALYAGEFRFAGGCRHDDGQLDLLWNASMGDYLRRYAAAWPRHVRARRGLAVRDDPGVVVAARVTMEWAQPVAWQLDGEEMEPARRFDVDVQPAALRVLVAA